MESVFKFNKVYQPVFTTTARYIDIMGGRGAGRSHFGTEYFRYLISQPVYFRGCFLRNVAGDIRDSLFKDFKDRIEEVGEEDQYVINESKMTVVHKRTGNMIISKGFRKSSGNRSGKLKSLAGITHVLIEEADENEEEDVNKLDDSIRTDKIENIQIIFLHNPPPKNHWLRRRFYSLAKTGIKDPKKLDKDGNPTDIPYYKAVPLPNPDVLCIFSTYLDNLTNLNAKTVWKYKEYGRPDSPFFNEEMYYVDVCGFIPEGARGRVYKDWFHVTKAFFDSLPYDTYYGLDFGYSTDPVALVAIKTHNNRNFYHELIYETELTNPALAARMRALGIPRNAEIYADAAEPKSIAELIELGFYRTQGADKGPDSINFGIKVVKAMVNFATNESKNLWFENEEYKWQLDSNGEPIDKPVDKNNHLKDALRGAVVTRKSLKRKSKVTAANTAHVGPNPKEEQQRNLLDYV